MLPRMPTYQSTSSDFFLHQFFVSEIGGSIKIMVSVEALSFMLFRIPNPSILQDMRSATVLKSLQVDGGAPLLDADWNMIDPRRIGIQSPSWVNQFF